MWSLSCHPSILWFDVQSSSIGSLLLTPVLLYGVVCLVLRALRVESRWTRASLANCLWLTASTHSSREWRCGVLLIPVDYFWICHLGWKASSILFILVVVVLMAAVVQWVLCVFVLVFFFGGAAGVPLFSGNKNLRQIELWVVVFGTFGSSNAVRQRDLDAFMVLNSVHSVSNMFFPWLNPFREVKLEHVDWMKCGECGGGGNWSGFPTLFWETGSERMNVVVVN